MIFKEMDQDEVLKALEGQKDILSDEMKKHEEYFAQLRCISCSCDEVVAFVDPESLFSQGSFLPNYMARCSECGCEFTPYTKLQTSSPD